MAQARRGTSSFSIRQDRSREEILDVPRHCRARFNILQSHFISSLVDANRIIAIGHKFGDVNIGSPIKALLERPNFKLSLVSPDAERIKKTIFNDHPNIEGVPEKIESWMPKRVELILRGVEDFEKERREANEEAERKKKEELERIRAELEEKYRPRYILQQIPIEQLTASMPTIGTRLCPNCGKEISILHTSCPDCGTKLR